MLHDECEKKFLFGVKIYLSFLVSNRWTISKKMRRKIRLTLFIVENKTDFEMKLFGTWRGIKPECVAVSGTIL